MAGVDPKVYFANERTFLKWLHTSVTLGSVATGLLGLSSFTDSTPSVESSGIRLVGLTLLAMSIVFCLQAISSFHTRARMLNMKRSDGFDNNMAPMAMALSLIVGFGALYVVALTRRNATHAATPIATSGGS